MSQYENFQELISTLEAEIDNLNYELSILETDKEQMEAELIQYSDKTRRVIANLRTILTGNSDIEALVSDSIRLLENIDA